MPSRATVVAIADAPQRNRLASWVNGLPDFHVIACTADLMNTYNEVEASLPKAVLISSSLASLPEFEVMRGLFSALDVRWLVVTDRASDANFNTPITAGIPQGSDLFAVSASAPPETMADQLRSLTRSTAARETTAFGTAQPTVSKLTASPARVVAPSRPRPAAPVRAPAPQTSADPQGQSNQIVLIGSSTGGVDALLSVLSAFPANCPPTLIVQHTGAGFGESLANLLDRQCAAQVSLASGKHPLRPGQIVIGAGTRAHLKLEPGHQLFANITEGSAVSGHLPSVDVLFRSATPLASRVTAALLTGMGRDGAEGLKELRDAGAHTIAQDEETSVVYGMPRAAVELGAACISLPLKEIGPNLLSPKRSKQEVYP